MKKITLMFILLTVSLGYSQSLPFDFSDPVQLMPGEEGTTSMIIDDAGNDVMQVVGGTADWDHVGITFDGRIDLSDPATNSITFRMKATTDLGVRNHLLKFEGGLNGSDANEVAFSTAAGTDWQIFTLDFDGSVQGNPGDYNKMIIFTDAGGGAATGTYLIDDIAGGTNIGAPPEPEAILPIDFSDAFELFNAGGSTPSLTTDAGDDVMQIVGGGGDWDNVSINFAQNVDLSDAANNTITFRMKATTDLGVRNHLLKFEVGSGGSATAEVAFSTAAGTAWQDFALDFDGSIPGGPGNYGQLFIFTDAGSGDTGTYLIDDIAGGTNIAPVGDPEAAPIPNNANGETYSIYNDTNGYTTVFPFIYDFGELDAGEGEPDLDPGTGVNLALKCDFSFAGYGQGEGGPDDVSAYNFVNFNYWAEPGVPGFQFRMISNSGGVTEHTYEIGTDEPVVTGQWVQVSIPMTHFTNLGFSSANFFQWKVETFMQVVTDPGTVYLDNIILTLNALSVSEFDTAQFKVFPNPTKNDWNISSSAIINTVNVYDILGKKVMSLSPNATEAVIDASKLKTGMYFAKMESDNGSKTVKLIKE
jgi:hypothetical protein|nr:T9SS type A sorting domain-containing protein [uncultured Psychroserpens sp.]